MYKLVLSFLVVMTAQLAVVDAASTVSTAQSDVSQEWAIRWVKLPNDVIPSANSSKKSEFNVSFKEAMAFARKNPEITSFMYNEAYGYVSYFVDEVQFKSLPRDFYKKTELLSTVKSGDLAWQVGVIPHIDFTQVVESKEFNSVAEAAAFANTHPEFEYFIYYHNDNIAFFFEGDLSIEQTLFEHHFLAPLEFY